MRFTEDFVFKVEEEIKMEDIVIENETFIRPSKIEVRGRDEGANHEDEQEKEKRQKLEGGGGGGGGGGGCGGGGLLDNLLSKLTSPRPTTEGNEDHAFEVNNDHHENGDARVRGDSEAGGDGEGGGEGGGGGGGGGVINNLISNLFRKSSEGESEGVKNDGGEERFAGRNEENEVIKKVDEETEGGNIHSNGGSLISNLVQDVAAPEGDEASILIQSIVHD